jgi:hypothetical protein
VVIRVMEQQSASSSSMEVLTVEFLPMAVE